jgi:hypothetical protein
MKTRCWLASLAGLALYLVFFWIFFGSPFVQGTLVFLHDLARASRSMR